MNIVFVCTGNACRSAAAEAILKKMVDDHGIEGIEITSCGLHVCDALERDPMMCAIAAEHGYAMGGNAIPVSVAILINAVVVVGMTERHRNLITQLIPYPYWSKIVLFNEYCFGEPKDLADPHFQTEYVYRTCFDKIEAGCLQIIKRLL